MNELGDSAATYVYLVRHGATDANVRRPRILQGSGLNLQLNEIGRREAAAVGRLLSGIIVQHVYTSPLERAVETARVIAAQHELEIRRIQSLKECNVGKWEGKDWKSIRRAYPIAYRSFMENPAENPYLDGESYGDVLDRMKAAIQKLLTAHAGQSIVVVAHNIINRVYLANLLGLELGKSKEIPQSNGCVNVIRHRNGRTELLTLNALFHLTEQPR